MGDRVSEEDYLDRLLHAVDGEKEDLPKLEPEKPMSRREALEREIFGEEDSKMTKTAKNEEEFMREFEQELLREEIPDYMEHFETESPAAAASSKKSRVDASIDDLLDHMPQGMAEPVVDEGAEFAGELPEPEPEAPEKTELEQAVGAFDEEHRDELTQGQNAQQPAAEGEVDLSGLSDSDLMEMLANDESLSDLGEMLTTEEEGTPIEEGDPIGDFAETEMEAQEKKKAAAAPKDEDGEEKKKGGFFDKFKKILFGDEEDEDELVLKEGEGANAAELSAENEQILKELGEAGKEEPKKGKKEKKKKEKKPKKKKEPKPKKPKKPKKEKPPKEPDNTPPLPKGPVIAIFVMAASLFGLVMLGTNLLGYQVNINTAKSVADSGDYVGAFENLQGITIKQKDEDLYNKLAALAAVSQKYEDYLVFDNYGAKDMALDSLVCAYGRYNLNKKYAGAYDCEAEFEELNGKILAALLEEYDMTGDEALAIYRLEDRDDYTLELHKKLRELGMEE